MALTRPTLQNINTNLTTFTDSILISNFGNIANRDIGMIYDRSQSAASNVALVWKESTGSFTFAFTNSSGLAAGNIAVTGNANVSVGNIIINGTGIFWANGTQFVSGGSVGTILTVDTFTGDGVTTDYPLSTAPASVDYTIVSLAGTFQPRNTYSVSGTTLTFSSAPPNTAPIEVTTFAQGSGGGGGGGSSGASNARVMGYSLVFGV